MPDLHDDLSQLARAIVLGLPPSPDISTAQAPYSTDIALDAYRNNYRGNLQDTLAGAYPVTKQLVGDNFFRHMARRFIEHYPSRSPNLHHYGAQFADFVTTFAPAQELAYLPDMAALEWACHVAYFAADAAPLDLTRLAVIPPEHYADLTLLIHPACTVVRSRFPITAIWQAHQPGADSDFHIALDSGPSIALVSRKEGVVQVSELSEAAADWLQCVQNGATFGSATATAMAHHPQLDLQALLHNLIAHSVLSDSIPRIHP